MIVGTTVTANIVDLLDLPAMELEWFVSTEMNMDGSMEMPMTVRRETLSKEIDQWAIKLITHVWAAVWKVEAELERGLDEVMDNLQPLRRE